MREENIDITHVGDDLAKAYEQGIEDGKPKWIPVSERLPDKCGNYLVVTKFDGDPVHEAVYLKAKKPLWFDPVEEYERYEVTHWMPLPEPPKEDT
jgi:hypothetical protein